MAGNRTVWGAAAIGMAPLAAVAAGLCLFKNLAVTFLLYHFLTCIGLSFIYIRSTPLKVMRLTEVLGLKNPGWRGILPAAGLGAASFAVIAAVFLLTGNSLADAGRIMGLLEKWGFRARGLLLLAAYFTLFNSVVEEIFWRGVVQSGFSAALKGPAMWAVVSFFFIQYHALTIAVLFSPAASLFLLPVLFAAGMAWSMLRERTGSVWPAVIWHLLADLGLIYCFLVQLPG